MRSRATFGAVLLLAGVSALGAVRTTAVEAATRTRIPSVRLYKCVGSEITITNSNTDAVQNGGTPPTVSTRGHAYCVLQIIDYHWNNGLGATPGSVGLTVVSGFGGPGKVVGPLPATGSPGQGGVPNANWTGTAPQAPQPVVIDGRYSCLDSDPGTWSQNAKSGGSGFCTLVVRRAVKAAPPKPATATYACTGPQTTLFDNSNFGGVQNGGKPPTFFTSNAMFPGVFSWCLNSISTYHWNNGAGSKPGTIGLRQALLNFGAPAPFVRPQQATGSSGQGGAPNVNWTVNFPGPSNPVVIGGGYFCSDSGPATWSQNQQSGGNGFCKVYATPAYVTNFMLPSGFMVPQPAPPTGTPPSGQPPGGQSCSTNTYGLPIVFPNHAAPGGPSSVLLACGTKTANSFTGVLTPTGGVFTVPFGNCLNGSPPPTQPFITYGTGPGQVNPNACPNSIVAIPWSLVPGNPLALQITAPSVPGKYLVFVRTARGNLGTASILNVP
jgi:hypothetical protein